MSLRLATPVEGSLIALAFGLSDLLDKNSVMKPSCPILVPMIAGLILLSLPACKKAPAPAVARPPVPVTIGTVIQKDMPNHKEWIGNLQGTVTSLVKPNVSGKIIQR